MPEPISSGAQSECVATFQLSVRAGVAIADDEEGEIQLYRNNGSSITAIDILYNSVNNGDEFNNMSMSSDGSKIAFINGETANYGEGVVMVYNYLG